MRNKWAHRDQAERARESMAEYRRTLVSAEQSSQEDFDKTVLTLSGGALGISFTFLKEVIAENPVEAPASLLSAWACWGFSTLCVLASFYLSHLALRRAIHQVDNQTIRTQRPGGIFSVITAALNLSGALLFFTGICFMVHFASINIRNKGGSNDNEKAAISATATTAAAPPSSGQ